VAAALHWGAPLLDSSLTLITKDGLYYRGSSVLELALNRSFWEVARWF
jgi:citrate synthase